ncbi:hypothetical protein TrLO_g6075 [Triparma laevis f. longispina]|uniref:Cytochrome b5 heme-binding domain-containing protein n=1 Tax=Triparma laevis f. longispina TaxID=1714387 RepID=A0A9W7CC99_9STRA|nr:hypothetical protein TrLO_g6075 [Triparma laevis f. longispina]
MFRRAFGLVPPAVAVASTTFFATKIDLNRVAFAEPKLREFSLTEVKESKRKVLVIYKNDVYDITNFVSAHPGGKDKIMLAKGSYIEPYWSYYPQHTNNKYVIDSVLSPMKVGTLRSEDRDSAPPAPNPYVSDPVRSHTLRIISPTPCNAETTAEGLESWLTDADDFYVRNHGPVPLATEKDAWKINLFSETFSVGDVKDLVKNGQLEEIEITATMQCGGNRRGYYRKKANGTQWGHGAISNAKWTGVRVKDLLKHLKVEEKGNWFNALSEDGTLVSIPRHKVDDEEGDVILAYKMNGGEIPRDHGYPVRLIVPGYVGVRNVKWLKKVWFGEEVSSMWQTGLAYKILPLDVDSKKVEKVDLSKYKGMMEMPVTSVIRKAVIGKDGILRCSGFAWSGGGRGIHRVDISVDGGHSWHCGRLKEGADQPPHKSWSWTFWDAEVDVKDVNVEEVVVKAVDVAGNSQPSEGKDIWNVRGLGNNSWHYRKIDREDEWDHNPFG